MFVILFLTLILEFEKMASIHDKELRDAMEKSQVSYIEELERKNAELTRRNTELTRDIEGLKRELINLEWKKIKNEENYAKLSHYVEELKTSILLNSEKTNFDAEREKFLKQRDDLIKKISEQSQQILLLTQKNENSAKLLNDILNNPRASSNAVPVELCQSKVNSSRADAKIQELNKIIQDLKDELAATKAAHSITCKALTNEEKNSYALHLRNCELIDKLKKLEKIQCTDDILFSIASFDMSTGNCEFIQSPASRSSKDNSSGNRVLSQATVLVRDVRPEYKSTSRV